MRLLVWREREKKCSNALIYSDAPLASRLRHFQQLWCWKRFILRSAKNQQNIRRVKRVASCCRKLNCWSARFGFSTKNEQKNQIFQDCDWLFCFQFVLFCNFVIMKVTKHRNFAKKSNDHLELLPLELLPLEYWQSIGRRNCIKNAGNWCVFTVLEF